MPEWQTSDGAQVVPLHQPAEDLVAERLTNELLREAVADLEMLYREDLGWKRIGDTEGQFSHEGRKKIAKLADLMATGNALIKRGLNLRAAYIWGQGVTATIADDGAEGQDVNAVWAEFWDEPSNRAVLTSSEAQVRLERKLGTAGEVFFALPTDPLTGRVRVRRIPPGQIVDRICDPDDEATVWLYKRSWTAIVHRQADGKKIPEERVEYFPALGFWPKDRLKIWYDGKPIRWEAPVRHIAVNVMDEDWRGLGDCFPAMPWAKLDKEFLEDLGLYMRAMTRILGQVTAKNGRAAQAAAAAARGAAPTAGNPNGVAGVFGMDPNSTFSMVSKTGAHIDADSHRPFATMVAAALDVPLTMLLGDPGATGARAVAETLDQPTELTMRLRQEVHAEFLRDLSDYVIDMAVVAPRGPLRGAVARDGDRLVITLPEGDQRALDVDWPEFSSMPLDVLVKAIAAADQTEAYPPLLTFLSLAKAFAVDDVDDWVEKLTDDDGNWIGLEAITSTALDQRDERGQGDPIPPVEEDPDDDAEPPA